MSPDVIVVGAGLSGLVVAHRLHRAGLSVRVFEADQRPGGVIGSERRNGVLFERGPNSAMDNTPAIIALLDELGIRPERIDASAAASRRYVVRGGRLMALPTSAASFISTPLFSATAKLRLFAEPLIRRAPANVEESVAQFVRRRLGREFLDYAVEPFVSGIYAGDPDQLSLAAAFPKLHDLEQRYGSLFIGAIRAAIARQRSPGTPRATGPSFSFLDGMQTLTDALAKSVPLECGMPVRRLEPRADGSWTVAAGTMIQAVARAVVLALPAHGAASLVGGFAPHAAEALSAIPYAPVGIVVTAYRRADVAHPLDGFGYLAPAAEKPALLGTLFSSTMFAQRADAGTVVFTSFLGGRRHPEHVGAPDGELLEIVRGELQRFVGARGVPVLSVITRWPQAIPQYAFGHRERIAVLEQTERERPGLYFRANYRGGVSVSDCISRGNELAQAVELQLAAARTVDGQRGNA